MSFIIIDFFNLYFNLDGYYMIIVDYIFKKEILYFIFCYFYYTL